MILLLRDLTSTEVSMILVSTCNGGSNFYYLLLYIDDMLLVGCDISEIKQDKTKVETWIWNEILRAYKKNPKITRDRIKINYF